MALEQVTQDATIDAFSQEMEAMNSQEMVAALKAMEKENQLDNSEEMMEKIQNLKTFLGLFVNKSLQKATLKPKQASYEELKKQGLSKEEIVKTKRDVAKIYNALNAVEETAEEKRVKFSYESMNALLSTAAPDNPFSSKASPKYKNNPIVKEFHALPESTKKMLRTVFAVERNLSMLGNQLSQDDKLFQSYAEYSNYLVYNRNRTAEGVVPGGLEDPLRNSLRGLRLAVQSVENNISEEQRDVFLSALAAKTPDLVVRMMLFGDDPSMQKYLFLGTNTSVERRKTGISKEAISFMKEIEEFTGKPEDMDVSQETTWEENINAMKNSENVGPIFEKLAHTKANYKTNQAEYAKGHQEMLEDVRSAYDKLMKQKTDLINTENELITKQNEIQKQKNEEQNTNIPLKELKLLPTKREVAEEIAAKFAQKWVDDIAETAAIRNRSRKKEYTRNKVQEKYKQLQAENPTLPVVEVAKMLADEELE